MTIEEFMRDIAPKMRPGWVAMDGSGQWYFFKTEPSRATFLKGKEMKLEKCTGCPYSHKTIPRTKPMWLCSYGRYKEAPGGGYPCAWIKKCEHHENITKKCFKSKSEGEENGKFKTKI